MVAPQKRQSFNNGTEGATVDATSSAGSGDAIAAPGTGGTGAAVFAAAAAIRGSKGCRVTGVAGDLYSMALTGTANGSASGQIMFTVDSTKSPTTAGWTFARFRSAAANGAIAVLSTARVLQVQNAAGTTLKNFNSNTALPDGQYVLNMQTTKGAGTTDGFIAAQLYSAADTTTVIDSYTSSVVNAGTADITQWQFGKPATGGGIDAYIDEPAFSTGTVVALDFVASNIAPTVDAGVDQNVAAGVTVNLSATGTDTDGTIASYAWTYDYPTSGAPTLTGGTTATPSFTAGAVGSLYVLRCTVTDNLGLTGVDTIEVRVPRAGSAVTRTLPITASTGTWTNVGGVATVGGALADESDSTYLETPTLTTTATVEKIRLDPSYARASGNLVLRLGTDTGTATATVRLVEGTTVRQTWTQAVTSTPTNYTFALTTTAINATSDWGRLFAEVSVVTP